MELGARDLVKECDVRRYKSSLCTITKMIVNNYQIQNIVHKTRLGYNERISANAVFKRMHRLLAG